MTKTGLEFGILVIAICLIFGICDLEFLFLQYSSTSEQLNTSAYQLVKMNMNVCSGVGKDLSNLSVDPRGLDQLHCHVSGHIICTFLS